MLSQLMGPSKRPLHFLHRHHPYSHQWRQLGLLTPGRSSQKILLLQLYSPRHLTIFNHHRLFSSQRLTPFHRGHRFTHHHSSTFRPNLAVALQECLICPTCPACPTCRPPVTITLLFRARLLYHNSNNILESFLMSSLISDPGHRGTGLNCSQHCTRRLKGSRWSRSLHCNTRTSSASSRGD